LAKFVQAVFPVGSIRIQLAVWDHKLIMKYWGKVSQYLHWAGAIDETIESPSWVEAGIMMTEEACLYIWNNQIQNETGVMVPDKMHPEIRHLWERYKEGEFGIEEVKISAQILAPAIR